jgi:fumarylacetoacetase
VSVRYGAFRPHGRHQRLGVQLPDGGSVLDFGELLAAPSGRFSVPWPELLLEPTLDPLLAAGARAWREVHEWLTELVADPSALTPFLRPVDQVLPVLPFTVADYVDFFACEQHAVNAARIFRPDDPQPVAANWYHQPVGYHGRSATVLPSGTGIRRPSGPRGPGDFGPTRMLDFEAELGFVVGGPPNPLGEPVPLAEAAERIFGVLLLNDWSARDVQFWETKPLGPLLGKAFATSISAWVTPLSALPRVDPPARDPRPLPYLLGPADQGFDLTVTVTVNGEVIATPPARGLYWTPAQLLTHLTSGGAVARPGDLLGSGTLSGARREQRGCLLELTWHAREPLALADGTELGYLRDGDEVVFTAPGLGEVRGRVAGAR